MDRLSTSEIYGQQKVTYRQRHMQDVKLQSDLCLGTVRPLYEQTVRKLK